VLLAAARAQTCEDDQTCQRPSSLGEEGSFLQARINDESQMDTDMENSDGSQTNTSMQNYVERVLGKVTALGGRHQNNDRKEFDIMIDNILKCGRNLNASNVSVTEMSPAVLLLGVEHDVCRNDSVPLRDLNHTAQTNYYNYMANPNMPDCAQNFEPGTCPAQQDFSVPLYFDNAIA
ncbi:unnamed protein product, partial [Symbiodinium sp. KB8]